ncbi:MAG TPA: TDP-N-acetylfucosamine:lipid II N-acetylfucosaminyltransferase [Chitinophagales bacterium]|nr:TDP-N-acetylfucosamine:lipid II N-acetylfucosaminyltransferase [Chitinophagales bacterium]
MNLHLIPDNGFLNRFIDITNRISAVQNNYLICSTPHPFSVPGKKKLLRDDVKIAHYGSKSFYDLIGDINRYEKIFIHFLSDQLCDFVNRNSESHAKFFWIFWGADFYTPLEFFAAEIFDEDSMTYYRRHGTFASTNNRLVDALKRAKRIFIQPFIYQRRVERRRKAIDRINYFLHYNPFDFEVVKKFFPTNAAFHYFFYYEFDYASPPDTSSEAVKDFRQRFSLRAPLIIQLGNSASLSNNHLGALKALSRFANEDFQIVCPLSYGDRKYAQYVIEIGSKLFGDKFIPVTTYLPKEDYLSLLQCIDIGVMNHRRSEGGANTVMLLAMGKKVFMPDENALNKFLNSNSIHIYSPRNFTKQSFAEFSMLLSSEQKSSNQSRVAAIFSPQRAEELMIKVENLK